MSAQVLLEGHKPDQVVWGKGEAKLARAMETGLQWVLQLKEQNGEEST